jgi:hypothetical protein
VIDLVVTSVYNCESVFPSPRELLDPKLAADDGDSLYQRFELGEGGISRKVLHPTVARRDQMYWRNVANRCSQALDRVDTPDVLKAQV